MIVDLQGNETSVTFMTTETNDERSVSLNTLENTVKKKVFQFIKNQLKSEYF